MKAKFSCAGFILSGVVLALLVVLFVGCATAKRTDWNGRVGNFTYDQAVAELGPPDKTATLGDGSTVGDWITRRSGGSSFSIGMGGYGSHTAVGVGQTIGSGYGERILRLTFGPDGRLTGWTQPSR